MLKSLLVSLLYLVLLTHTLDATNPKDIPPTLQEWQGWVLDEFKQRECPIDYQEGTPQCLWLSRIEISVGAKALDFNMSVALFEEDTPVTLPHLLGEWSRNVSVDGQKAIVLETDGKPSILLGKGEHRIVGSIALNSEAKYVELPLQVALVTLYKEGVAIKNPKIDAQGRLWFDEVEENTTQEGSLSVSLHRKIIDGHPIKMQTHLHFRVSGKMRSMVLDGIVLEGFLPTALTTPLNATITEDKKLLIDVKAGEWVATIDSYAPAPIERLQTPPYSFAYANEEIWAFQADVAYRSVEIEGVSAIDTGQTTLPKEWQGIPAYWIEKGKTMRLVELYKSAAQLQPNQLQLKRELWLDFDGGGYTISDDIDAKISKARRLDATPLLQLASVSINQQPSLITALDESGKRGVELRLEEMKIDSSSRYEGDISTLPANGWDEKFESVSTTLHLPPGWRLLGAFGSDNKTSAWLDQWNLMDIFLVLLLSIGLYQLYGWRWSLLATFFLVLLWQEPNAPTTLWLFVLAIVALLRVLKHGRLRGFVQFAGAIVGAIVVLDVLSFSVYQIRTALYPQLEKGDYLYTTTASFGGVSDTVAQPKKAMRLDKNYESSYDAMIIEESPVAVQNVESKIMQNRIDPNALIQTGIAKPNWQWHTYHFSWQSGVASDAKLQLWLISSNQHKILKILTLIGMLFLMFLFLRDTIRLTLPKLNKGAMLLVVSLIVSTSPMRLNASTIPTPEILLELKERLTQPPACLPHCAAIDEVAVAIVDENLEIEMRISSGELISLPLLGNRSVWLPQSVWLDGTAVNTLQLDTQGGLWIALTKGSHTITLKGTLEDKNQITLSSPLALHNLTLNADPKTWQFNSDRKSYIELNRLGALEKKQEELSHIEPLVEITRTFYFGQQWYVDTHVRLLNTIEQPFRLSYHLLANESILDKEIEQKEGKVVLHLDNKRGYYTWRSTLPITPTLQLKASHNPQLIEQWQMDIAPIWTMNYQGIEPIEHRKQNDTLMPNFKPWGNESLKLSFTKAKAVEGESLTIQSSNITLTQSSRYRDVTLEIVLKSSQAGQYAFMLQGVDTLKSATIDGITHYLKIDNGKVSIPLKATSQTVTLGWREEIGVDNLYRFPVVNLNKSSTNQTTTLYLPHNRWILWSSGPLVGPAVLLWGVLLAVVLFALVLGRIEGTPLKSRDWLLLGFGVSTTSVMIMLPVVIWIFLLRYRQIRGDDLVGWRRNLTQVAIVVLTFMALGTIVGAVSIGLLGNPDMMITGNNSYTTMLNWYSDRIDTILPQPTVITLSIWYYRILMLVWSIWIAFSLIKWLKWAWSLFSQGDMWHKRIKQTPAPQA
ncbi:MAG: hypothetical protein KU38_11790 [Sulfurovum sp. FS08-3]|nr:MAG: hypothetical protein KU38_11790 [Sulfurovum sp. FS08-3]